MFFVIPVAGVLLVALLSMRASRLFNTSRGSGTVVTEKRDVRGYHAVSLSGTGDLSIDQNGTEGLTIEAEDNIITHIRTEVRGGTLQIGFDHSVTVNPSRPIRFYLNAATLDGISVSGAGNASAPRLEAAGTQLSLSGAGSVDVRNLSTGKLSVNVSGSGTAAVSGSAPVQDVHLSGSGDYSAAGLATREATMRISGAGRATVRVSDRIDARISGAGTVTYIGNPAISKHISGAGSISKLSDN